MYRGFWLWEAQSIVFYVFGRLWEAHFVVIHVFGRLVEAHSVVFYEGLRLWGAQCLTELSEGVGPLKRDLTCVGDLSWDHTSI